MQRRLVVHVYSMGMMEPTTTVEAVYLIYVPRQVERDRFLRLSFSNRFSRTEKLLPRQTRPNILNTDARQTQCVYMMHRLLHLEHTLQFLSLFLLGYTQKGKSRAAGTREKDPLEFTDATRKLLNADAHVFRFLALSFLFYLRLLSICKLLSIRSSLWQLVMKLGTMFS